MNHGHFITIVIVVVIPLPVKFSSSALLRNTLHPSPLATFLLSVSPLSSALFVFHLSSPCLSCPLPRPSVYPIWLSHLSWELSQGTRLLIQFLLNLMAVGSAFAIAAAGRQTKQGGKKMKNCLEDRVNTGQHIWQFDHCVSRVACAEFIST